MSKDKLFSTILSGVGIAGIANAAASVYNNRQKIAVKESAMQRHLDLMEEKLALEKYQAGLDPNVPVTASIKNATPSPSAPESQSEDSPVESSGILDDKLDATIYTEPIIENSVYNVTKELDPTTSVDPEINSPLETDLDLFDWDFIVNDDSVTQPLGLSIMCFAFIGITCGILLGYNMLITYYSERYDGKIPKWVVPLMKMRVKYSLLSNSLYLFILVISQSLLFSVGLYFYLYGV